MKIAIATDGGFVSAHFGRCPSYTIVDVENGELIGRQTIDNPGHHPGFLPQFLSQQGVNCIVAGGMGRRAQDLFAQAGIETVLGVSGNIDEVISELLKGSLEGGESLCQPGAGRGYGLDKTRCDHQGYGEHEH